MVLNSEIQNILWYEGNWPDDTQTERHALSKMCELMPVINTNKVYLGFPWTALFSLLEVGAAYGHVLMQKLHEMKEEVGCREVITVCEYRDLLIHQKLFSEFGVRDIFWPYTRIDLMVLPSDQQIKLHPFPLYGDFVPPVKKILPHKYKGAANTVGYSYCDINESLENLWRCVVSGVIPLVTDSNIVLPGGAALWRQATVIANKNAVEQSSQNMQTLVDRQCDFDDKKNALSQIALLYGSDCFVYDVLMLLINSDSYEYKENPLFELSLRELSYCKNIDQERYFVVCCLSRILVDCEKFIVEVNRCSQAHELFWKCVSKEGDIYSQLRKAIKLKNINKKIEGV